MPVYLFYNKNSLILTWYDFLLLHWVHTSLVLQTETTITVCFHAKALGKYLIKTWMTRSIFSLKIIFKTMLDINCSAIPSLHSHQMSQQHPLQLFTMSTASGCSWLRLYVSVPARQDGEVQGGVCMCAPVVLGGLIIWGIKHARWVGTGKKSG